MRIILGLFMWGMTTVAFSQGCSDAGFCTMGAMKPDQSFSRQINFKLRSVEFSYYRGTSTLSPVIYSVTADLNFGISDKLGFQVKVPYQWVKGRLGNTQSVGDISFSVTQNLYRTEQIDLNFTLGGKIPTNNSTHANANGLDLPMYYQTSLGSYDVIAGLSLLTNKWLVAIGYQQALTSNDNEFRFGEWIRFPDREYVRSYDSGVGLRRGIDLMLRTERSWRFLNYSFSLAALPIYRITPDRGLVIQSNEDRGEIKTTGLALSVLAGFTYHVSTSSGFKVLYGYKLLDRKTNPDGLTRDDVFTMAYLLRF